MPTVIRFRGNKRICMVSLKPHSPPGEDLISTLVSLTTWFEDSAYLKSSFILRSVHGNLVMWFGFWCENSEVDSNQMARMRAALEILTNMAQVTGPFYQTIYGGQSKTGLPSAKVSRGDFVTTRTVWTEREKQECLCNTCMTILQSYFQKAKEVRSFTCFRSLDGDKVTSLGVWTGLAAAYAWILDSSPFSRKLIPAHLADLVLSTSYDIMEVVYSSGDDPLPLPPIAYLPLQV